MFMKRGRYVFAYPGMAVVAEPRNLRRPPNEAHSLIFQATIGCPWNRCVFCGNYLSKQFTPRYPDVLEDISIAKDVYGEIPHSVFLADANSLVLKTEWLLEIAEACFEAFPKLERVSSYGSAKFVVRRGPSEWRRLCEAGIRKVYLGLETGDDDLLRRMNKGATQAEMLQAGQLLKEAGMELSVTVIQGLGGKGSWRRNGELTANALNAMGPHETRLHDLVIHSRSLLFDQVLSGEFQEATPDEVLLETREVIKRLEIETRIYTYRSNYLKPGLLDGSIPDDREYMLSVLDFALTSPDRNLYLQTTRMI